MDRKAQRDISRKLRVLDHAKEHGNSTSVYWSPVLPKNADEIPERVKLVSRGQNFRVSKEMPLRYQTLEYNVFLFITDFEEVDLSSFPLTPSTAIFSMRGDLGVGQVGLRV
jgi:hypothetical protein